MFPQKYKEILAAWFFGDPTMRKNSRASFDYVNEQMVPDTVSRASVINFLNECVDEGYLGFDQTPGKGGYHRVYKAEMDTDGFWRYVSQEVNTKLAPYVKGQA